MPRHTILLATTSQAKVAQYKEVVQTLYPKGSTRDFRLLTLNSTRFLKNQIPVAPEESNTTQGNAVDKAIFYAHKTNLPVICDDSAFCVDFLHGKPGIRSHRDWTPEKVQAQLRKRDTEGYLLRAHYETSCAACLADASCIICHTDTSNGAVTLEHTPDPEAYGYDDIFMPECVMFNKITYHEWLKRKDVTRFSIDYPRSVAFCKTFVCLLERLRFQEKPMYWHV